MHAQVQFGGLEVLNEPTDGLYFLVNHLLDSFPKTPPASLFNNSQKRHDFTTLHMSFNGSPATSSSTWSSTLSESSELIFHENEVTPGRGQCGLAGPDCNIIRKRKKIFVANLLQFWINLELSAEAKTQNCMRQEYFLCICA